MSAGEDVARMALQLALGPDFAVSHVVDDTGDTLRIEWDGGAFAVRGFRLWLAFEAGRFEGDGFERRWVADARDPTLSVGRHGRTYSMTRVPLPWWHWRSLWARARRWA